MALVSIIIPHYNRARLLAETIDSVKSQSYRDWEVIVVDDGSEEQEWLGIRQLADERIRIMRRTDGLKGPSRCRNLGAAESRGEYLIFLDSDDLLAPWCLSMRIKKAKESPDNDIWLFPVMLFAQSPGDLSVCWNRLEGEDDLERFLRSDPPWHTSSPLWRREAFSRTGGFNEAVMYGDDADLHIKTLLKGIKHTKYSNTLPDVFIRRSNEPRITGEWSSSLVESRLVRLSEGTSMLALLSASAGECRIWEGQYFVEAEELLFNVNNAKQNIFRVVDLWSQRYRPSLVRKASVRLYFRVCLLFIHRAYIIVRIARRLAMIMMPASFFPRGGFFHRWNLRAAELSALRSRLRHYVPE